MAARTADLAAYGATRFAAHQRACAARPDRTHIAAGYTGPKLVVASRDDRVIPFAAQDDMAVAIGAEFAVVGETGHMVVVGAPKAVADALAAWLQAA